MNRNGADAAGIGFGTLVSTNVGGIEDASIAELGYTWNSNSRPLLAGTPVCILAPTPGICGLRDNAQQHDDVPLLCREGFLRFYQPVQSCPEQRNQHNGNL